MTIRPAYLWSFVASGYAAMGHAFLASGDWRLLPLVIWLVAVLVTVVYGKETRYEA